jgi:hypothetical protein
MCAASLLSLYNMMQQDGTCTSNSQGSPLLAQVLSHSLEFLQSLSPVLPVPFMPHSVVQDASLIPKGRRQLLVCCSRL